jgi:hypothetical protein
MAHPHCELHRSCFAAHLIAPFSEALGVFHDVAGHDGPRGPRCAKLGTSELVTYPDLIGGAGHFARCKLTSTARNVTGAALSLLHPCHPSIHTAGCMDDPDHAVHPATNPRLPRVTVYPALFPLSVSPLLLVIFFFSKEISLDWSRG